MRYVLILLVFVLTVVSGSGATPLPWEVIWEPETLLTNPNYTNSTEGAPGQSKIAVTSNGQVHVVWHSSRDTPRRPQIYYKRFIPGEGWSDDTCISGDLAQGEQCCTPAIACDSQGNLHVVWRQYLGYNIWYKMRQADGVWDSLSTLLSVPSTLTRYTPVVTCTPDNHVHVVWGEYYPLYGYWLVHRERVGPDWLPQCTVDSLEPTCLLFNPGITSDRNNNLHLTYSLQGGRRGTVQVYYRCRSEGVWLPRERASLGSDSISQSCPSISVNPLSNEPHIVWWAPISQSSHNLIFHSWRAQGGWQEREIICDTDYAQNSPSLIFTGDGVGHVVWAGLYGGEVMLIYNERTASGQWLGPAVLTTDTIGKSYLFLTNGGRSQDSNHLYVVWTWDRPGTGIDQVYFKQGRPGPQGVRWDEDVLAGPVLGAPLSVTGLGRIAYAVDHTGFVRLKLYDATGRLVQELVAGKQEKGNYTARIPEGVCSGIYFVRLEVPGYQETAKAVLLR